MNTYRFKPNGHWNNIPQQTFHALLPFYAGTGRLMLDGTIITEESALAIKQCESANL